MCFSRKNPVGFFQITAPYASHICSKSENFISQPHLWSSKKCIYIRSMFPPEHSAGSAPCTSSLLSFPSFFEQQKKDICQEISFLVLSFYSLAAGRASFVSISSGFFAPRTVSLVTTHFVTFWLEGTSYMESISRDSTIARSPRAPVLRSSASLAISFSASGSKSNSTPSISKRRLNCFVSAFLGWVRILIDQIFQATNRVEKIISEQGFEAHRMSKQEIKRFLALYFEASMYGETMPDYDGEQYIEQVQR